MCLLMQYCSNGDLATRIREQGVKPFDMAKIVEWFDQMSQALEYLHARNVVHRDIKVSNFNLYSNFTSNYYSLQPQNVMIDNALIADFGVANIIESTGRSKFTLYF